MDALKTIAYKQFSHISALPASLQSLANQAKAACNYAYAPYSHFLVGAAILLENDTIILGANQENASYSLTICAERTALGNVSMQFPNIPIKCIAITFDTNPIKNPSSILSPCGACRQHILEYQQKQTSPIAILMIAPDNNCILVEHILDLLPFAFTSDSLPL
jgi:cytidine deaminase